MILLRKNSKKTEEKEVKKLVNDMVENIDTCDKVVREIVDQCDNEEIVDCGDLDDFLGDMDKLQVQAIFVKDNVQEDKKLEVAPVEDEDVDCGDLDDFLGDMDKLAVTKVAVKVDKKPEVAPVEDEDVDCGDLDDFLGDMDKLAVTKVAVKVDKKPKVAPVEDEIVDCGDLDDFLFDMDKLQVKKLDTKTPDAHKNQNESGNSNSKLKNN